MNGDVSDSHCLVADLEAVDLPLHRTEDHNLVEVRHTLGGEEEEDNLGHALADLEAGRGHRT